MAVKIDLAIERRAAATNRRERLAYVDAYVEWLRRTPNRVWSHQQGHMIDSVLRSARRERR